MGKVSRNTNKSANRSDPLDQQITDSRYAKVSTRVKARNHQEDDKFVNDKLTKKILSQARQQQEDLEEEVGASGSGQNVYSGNIFKDFDQEDEDENDLILADTGSDFMEEIQISEEDERALESFNCKDPVKSATLADIIKEKLTEKKTEINTMYSEIGSMKPEDLEKILPLYKGVAQVLSRYRSGKLPKAFKFIPKFTNWEEILYLTEPDKWSAAAMYQATRIFASNLKDNMAQRFYNLVLLPRLRDDIAECKVLNFHLYQALKKALFKPAAFFKGIIIPLCESRTCTLREATIFGSVMAKNSIPLIHSSVCLYFIARMEYSGANSIFMRVLLEKKYALPYRVIDGVVDHFRGFFDDDRVLPLLWHQCLLTFSQVYKNDISVEQQRELLRLLTVHNHQYVSPEIRKELQVGACRNTQTSMESCNLFDCSSCSV